MNSDGVDRIIQGDSLEVSRGLGAGSVHCVVTSPPYWGLRDYGTALWEGGDPQCDHQPPDDTGMTTKPSSGQRQHAGRFFGDTCWKCGARRIDKQLGLEKTPEEYVSKLVEILHEVKRVLRDDGTLWLNLGDSYAAHNGGSNGYNDGRANRDKRRAPGIPPSLKAKDLVGIPWRVALALQADGWWLRSDIIWHKPNPMPESVRDRCTKSHEYIFMLSKSKKYYYDADAIKEASTGQSGAASNFKRDTKDHVIPGQAVSQHRLDRNPTSDNGGRNKRDVWTVTTKPFKGAHFAVFPPDLIRPCVLAGCPKDGIVLDPFIGSGTVGIVAKQERRHYLGIELNSEYAEMARARIKKEAPMDRLV